MGDKHWIEKAIPKSHEGLFSAKAKRAGESTAEYARQHDKGDSKLAKQARLAETLMRMKK